MAIQLDRFNSSLLNSVQKYYKGPFHQKLSDALKLENWEKDLGKACMAMFPISSSEITPPTMEMIQNYGNGDIGSDYLVNLFIDDRMGRIITAFRSLPRDQGPNFEALRPIISDLSFLGSIQRSYSANEGRLAPLFYMKLLYDGFARLVLRKLNLKLLQIEKITFPVEDTEALSFLGISSLISGFLNDILTQFFMHPGSSQFNLLGIAPYTSAKKPWLLSQRFFPIERALENEDFQNNELFGHFFDFNSRYIAEAKPDLPVTLSRLLSSSSFIWDQKVFGINPGQVEAMSEEQRLQLLMKNKTSIIERCFDYLEEEVDFKEAENQRSKLLLQGNRIESTLKNIEHNETLLTKTLISKNQIKSSLRELLESFGEPNEMQIEAEILSLVEKTPLEMPAAEGLEKLTFDLVSRYRREVLLEASYEEKITEETEKLRTYKEELAKLYASIGNEYLAINGERTSQINAILQVHTVFSYILFNKEIFPERARFSELQKQSAGKKIVKFLKKKKTRSQLRKPPENLLGTIQDFLNSRSNQIFEKYTKEPSKGVRALSQEEIGKMVSVSRAIQTNPEGLIKFDRFEKVLEDLLIKDGAFLKACENLSGGLSTEKIIKLQTHMNACLLFTEGRNASEATGLQRSLGFRKLHQAIVQSMRGESINDRFFRDSSRIIDQLESFNYPPRVVRSFQENIQQVYNSVTPDQMRDIELNLQPLNVEEIPQIREKKALLEETRTIILERAPRGRNVRLSKKSRVSRVEENYLYPAEEAIKYFFEGGYSAQEIVGVAPELGPIFIEGDKIPDSSFAKTLLKQYKNRSFSYGQLVDALIDFMSREQIETNLLSPGVMWNVFGSLSTNEKNLAVLVGIYEEKLKEYNLQVSELKKKSVTELVRKRGEEGGESRASVFDNTTLFQYYKRKQEKFPINQQISEELYDQFLPLFLVSYLSPAANLTYGSSFFVKEKLNSIREFLPGVDKVYGQLDAFLISRGQKLAKLEEFFKDQATKNGFLEKSFLEKLKTQVEDIVAGPLNVIGQTALSTAIVGLAILSYTGSSILAVVGGMAISIFWQTSGKVFVRNVFETARETIRRLFGEGYSSSSINDYILDLFKAAFETEVQLVQSDRQGQLEGQHLFSNALFLQEEFSILRNSSYSLFEFKNRLHMLLSNALENANFSTMLLNLFFKFNEPLFLSVPAKLLKNTGNPLFLEAMSEYCETYSTKINEEKERFLSDGHTEAECALVPGEISPFKDYLTQKANAGELSLTFSRNSSVHQFLNEQEMFLENVLNIPIEETQIVPAEISPNNLKSFLRTIKVSPAFENQFLGAISPVLRGVGPLINPSQNHVKTFSEGLRSSYFVLRQSLDMAKRLQSIQSSGISEASDRWLASTNATGSSIFLSPLFRECFSLLLKTTELADSLGIQEGETARKILQNIRQGIETYLNQGVFVLPNLTRLQDLERAISSLLQQQEEFPQIVFPIALESERNQSILLPFTIWSFGQTALSEELGRAEGAVALRAANQSNIIYLSNQAIELFFTSNESRGFVLSPMMMDALEDAMKQYSNQSISRGLGILNERLQARIQALPEAQSYQPNIEGIREQISQNMARRQGQPLALPAPQQGSNASSQATPLAAPQSPIVEPNREVASSQNNFANAQQPYGSPQQQMRQGQPQQLVGQDNIQPQVNQQPQGGPGQGSAPIGVQGQALVQGGSPQQQQSSFLPIVMGGQLPMQQQPSAQQVPQPLTMEERAMQGGQSEGQNLVMVGANGSSGSFSGGVGQAGDPSQPQPIPQESEAAREFRERGERLRQVPDRPPEPPIMVPPSRPYVGPMNMGDFPQYQQQINQPQGFSYGNAAAVGGGLMLGAALLSQMMKKDKEEEN